MCAMRKLRGWVCGLVLSGSTAVWAAESATSATVGAGTAGATARYSGDVGFARTDSQTGRVDLARGVAVGVDQNGLSLSVSHAVRPEHGPALAANMNVAIGRTGVATSTGLTVASPGPLSSAAAGGSASTNGWQPHSSAQATGRSGPDGHVRAFTTADSAPAIRDVVRRGPLLESRRGLLGTGEPIRRSLSERKRAMLIR